MTLETLKQEGKITVFVEGRVDTTTSPELGKALDDLVPETDELTLDMEKLIYISSAGLRVLLAAHKSMSKKGGFLQIKNITPEIMEIFEITGFNEIEKAPLQSLQRSFNIYIFIAMSHAPQIAERIFPTFLQSPKRCTFLAA